MILGQTPTPDIPVGGIILWSGSTSNIPTKWHLCDGTNGTPDLRDRFVVGAGSDYSVGDTGGEAEHTLTIGEMPRHNHTASNSHKHTFTGTAHTHTTSTSTSGLEASSSEGHTHSIRLSKGDGNLTVLPQPGNNFIGGTGETESAGNHTHTVSGNVDVTVNSTTASGTVGSASLSITTTYTGNGQPHNNLPPYYALCYIMKIA